MTKRKILITSLLSVLFLSIVSYFSLKMGRSFNPETFNLATCFLAGFSVALIAIFFAMNIGHIEKIKDYKSKSFLVTLLSAIIAVFLWKMAQNFSGNVPIDLLAGILGGATAHFYFTKNKKTNPVVHYRDFYFSKTVKHKLI